MKAAVRDRCFLHKVEQVPPCIEKHIHIPQTDSRNTDQGEASTSRGGGERGSRGYCFLPPTPMPGLGSSERAFSHRKYQGSQYEDDTYTALIQKIVILLKEKPALERGGKGIAGVWLPP